MTKVVFDGYKKANPESKSVKENFFTLKSTVSVSGYNGEVYGGDVYYPVFDE